MPGKKTKKMGKKKPEEPLDLELQTQKEVSELKESVDILKEGIKDRDTELLGLKKAKKETQRQMEQFAITLGVPNDYPTLLGEMEKLICMEDEVEELRRQMRALKGEDKEEVVKAITQGEKAVDKMKGKVDKLSGEVVQLKARRSVDRYKSGELAKETMKKFISNLLEFPRRMVSKIKGVIIRGAN